MSPSHNKEILGDFLGGNRAGANADNNNAAEIDDTEGVHRSATPMPDLQEEEEPNGPWTVGPSEEPSSFLADDMWESLHQRHIRVAFTPSFQRGAYIGRQASTCLPFWCNDVLERGYVQLYWSDYKGRKTKGDVRLQDVEPAIPKKKGLNVMVMSGDKRGVVAKVNQVKRVKNKAVLEDDEGTWEADISDLCIVEEHTNTCDCITY